MTRVVVSLSVVLGLTVGVVGQEPVAGSPQSRATFTSGVDLVTITASVRDSRGRVVRDLVASDFTVLDTGEQTAITGFYAGAAPVSLAVLLDISGSMHVGRNIDRAREAVALVVQNLDGAADEAALYTFDSHLQQVAPFGTDLDRIRQMGLAGEPWGQTSLYDAIAEAASSVSARDFRHRALLVITDGVDTGSRLSAPEVSAVAASIDVPVYLLTVATPLDHPGEALEAASDSRPDRTATLTDLARWTGGDMRVVSTSAHALVAVRDILTELRHQYLISFEPGERPGWHPIELRTRKRNHVVRTRGGYLTAPGPGS